MKIKSYFLGATFLLAALMLASCGGNGGKDTCKIQFDGESPSTGTKLTEDKVYAINGEPVYYEIPGPNGDKVEASVVERSTIDKISTKYYKQDGKTFFMMESSPRFDLMYDGSFGNLKKGDDLTPKLTIAWDNHFSSPFEVSGNGNVTVAGRFEDGTIALEFKDVELSYGNSDYIVILNGVVNYSRDLQDSDLDDDVLMGGMDQVFFDFSPEEEEEEEYEIPYENLFILKDGTEYRPAWIDEIDLWKWQTL